MNSNAPARSPDALAEQWSSVPQASWLMVWLRGIATVVELEVRKLWHDPTEVATRAVQPALWLLIFGQAFGRLRAIPTGNVPYQAFLAPGILAQSMMFISIFFGIAIIWERDLGLMQKLLALPLPRSVFILGKSLAAGIRSLTQMLVILALAAIMRIPLRWQLLPLLGVIVTIMLGAMIFASFSMILASIVKTRERFMGLGQLFTMPFFFASNALYPISIMPPWLQALAQVNPLTYVVSLLRAFLVTGTVNAPADFTILIAVAVLMVAIATRLYPTAIY
ncbi:MAG: ABC transporter permease [Thermacetogeniaceae bacterium]